MATIIDALLITLGLDTKKLEEGSKKAQDALEKTGKTGSKAQAELDASVKKVAETLVKVKNQAMTVTAVFLGGMGLKEFVKDSVQAKIQLDNVSKSVGMSVDDLEAWRRASERAGGTADAMSNAFKTVAQSFQNFELFGEFDGLSKTLYALNIPMMEIVNGATKARPAVDIMLDLADALSKVSRPKANAIGAALGFDENAINLLSMGREGIRKSLAEVRKNGLPTAQDVEVAKAAAVAYRDMDQAAQNLANTLMLKLAPAATSALKAATQGLRDPWNFIDRLSEFYGIKPMGGGVKLTPEAERRARGVSGKVIDEQSPKAGGFLLAALERRMGLPAGLLDAVWSTESGRGKHMLSPAGAQGHFQFMPGTAKAYGLSDPNHLGQSASAAARMFSDLLRQYGGNLQMALAAYNWGSGNLQKFGMANAPKETRDYISKVMGQMQVGASARHQALAGGGGGPHVEVNIGTITTQATDASSLARELEAAVGRSRLAAQANGGMR